MHVVADRLAPRIGVPAQVQPKHCRDRPQVFGNGCGHLIPLQSAELGARHAGGECHGPLAQPQLHSTRPQLGRQIRDHATRDPPSSIRRTLSCAHALKSGLTRLSGTCGAGRDRPPVPSGVQLASVPMTGSGSCSVAEPDPEGGGPGHRNPARVASHPRGRPSGGSPGEHRRWSTAGRARSGRATTVGAGEHGRARSSSARHPPSANISTFGSRSVAALRSSEYRSVRAPHNARMIPSTSSSEDPARIGPLRSVPCTANRHV